MSRKGYSIHDQQAVYYMTFTVIFTFNCSRRLQALLSVSDFGQQSERSVGH